MKKFLLIILIIPALLISCLKRDVLKQEANTNFRESEFYTSGEFHNKFDIVIQDTQIIVSTAPDGSPRCKPIFTFGLTESFIKELEKYWFDDIEFILSEETSTNNQEIFFSEDYRATFRSLNRGSVPCGDTRKFNLQLNLLDPNTGRVVAHTTPENSDPKQFSISTP